MKATAFCSRHSDGNMHVVELDLPNIPAKACKTLAAQRRIGGIAKTVIAGETGQSASDWSCIAVAFGPAHVGATLRAREPRERWDPRDGFWRDLSSTSLNT